MLWAAACVGFFGFLRAAEFTVPTLQGYDPEVHLSLQDVAIDSHSSPSVVRLRIKQSKTNPLRQGVDIFPGVTPRSVQFRLYYTIWRCAARPQGLSSCSNWGLL